MSLYYVDPDYWVSGYAEGDVTLTLPAIPGSAALTPPTVVPGAVSLTGAFITSGAVLVAPQVAVGQVTLSAPAIGSTEALFAPDVVTWAGGEIFLQVNTALLKHLQAASPSLSLAASVTGEVTLAATTGALVTAVAVPSASIALAIQN